VDFTSSTSHCYANPGSRIPTHPWVALYASPTVLSRVEEHPSYHPSNGAGSANLKVGAAIWRINGARNIFLVVPLHFFGFKAQLVVLVSAFMMVSTVWSVSCMLFFYSRCPRAQPFVSGGARAPVPYGVGATDPSHAFSLTLPLSLTLSFKSGSLILPLTLHFHN